MEVRACLHEGEGPQIGEVTCGGSPQLSCKRDQMEMRDNMTGGLPPPNWGPPPPCKQALNIPQRLHVSYMSVRTTEEKLKHLHRIQC